MTVLEELQALIRETFNDNTIVINEQTTAASVEGWDSLTHVSLVIAAEKAFGIRFNTTEIARLTNVGQFAETIRNRTGRA